MDIFLHNVSCRTHFLHSERSALRLRALSLAIAASCPLFAKNVVAVVDIANAANQTTALSSYFADDLCAKLSADTGTLLVERGQLSRIFAEQGLQAAGAFDEKTIARIGSLSGANRIVFGKYYAIGDDYEIMTKTVDVASGKIVATEKNKVRRTESLSKLDQMPLATPANTSTPQAATTSSSTTSKAPLALDACKPFGTSVVCDGILMPEAAGTIEIDQDESVAYFENGSKARFGNPIVAGGDDRRLIAKIRQSFQVFVKPNIWQNTGNFTMFHLVYKFNGKSYAIDQAPPMK